MRNSDEIKAKLNELMEFYNKENLQSLPYNECFPKTYSILERAKKEFDAKLFFILMFGPLKAGKSTLTNLLAREYVSPTGFGLETTLYPSIILKSDSNNYSIDVYEMVDQRDDKEELFNKVIDILRGISAMDDCRSRIRKITYPLEKKYIKQQLTEPLEVEPLITVLRVPGGQLVTEQIALIDMPGLDGVKSNWIDSVVHRWILERADFLIFIQSSMSALNKATVDFLKDAYLGSKKPPLWLVQNIIDAKYWREQEDRDHTTEAQKEEAKKQIKLSLGLTEDLRSTAINLGKADDGMSLPNDVLLSESHFLEFEKNLEEIMSDSRVRIQQENSIKGVSAAIKNCCAIFDDYIHELNDLMDNNDAYIKELEELERTLRDIGRYSRSDDAKRDIDLTVENIIKEWYGKCSVRILDMKQNFSQKSQKQSDDVIKIFKGCAEDINGYLSSAIDEARKKRTFDDVANRFYDKSYDCLINTLNVKLKSLEMDAYERKICFEPEIKKGIDFLHSDTEIIKKWKSKKNDIVAVVKSLGKTDKFYKNNVDYMCDWFEEKHDEYKDDTEHRLKLQINEEFKDWNKKFISEIKVYVEDQVAAKERVVRQENQNLKDSIGYIEKLKSMCNELDNYINSAIE